MAKKKWPKKLIAFRMDDGAVLVAETPEDIGEDFDGEPVGVYELTHVGKFACEKQVDAKPVKKGRRS